MESKEELQAEEVEDEGPPPGYQTILPPPQPQPPSPPPPPPPQPSSSSPPKEAAEPVDTPSTDSTPIHTPTLTPKSTLPAQMICGSCHRLLKYPPGAKQVQCSCCQTFNFVLEAHQVGQVKCGSCTALMYPYGASQVRCSCCQLVTEIGAQNQRPPWSAEQGPPLPGLKPFPSTALFFAN